MKIAQIVIAIAMISAVMTQQFWLRISGQLFFQLNNPIAQTFNFVGGANIGKSSIRSATFGDSPKRTNVWVGNYLRYIAAGQIHFRLHCWLTLNKLRAM